MPRVLRPLGPALSVFAGGLCLALTLPRPGFCFLAWLALVPLLLFSARRDSIAPSPAASGAEYAPGAGGKKHPSPPVLGGIFGLAFYGLTFHWIYSTCRFAGLSVFTAALAWAALSGAMSVNWILFAVVSSHLRKGLAVGRSPAGRTARANERGLPDGAWPWACAAAWTAIEFAGARWTPGLGLVLLAYTQWGHLTLVQGAALAGPHVLSFLIVLWSASVAAWIDSLVGASRREEMRANGSSGDARWRMPAVAAALLAVWWLYGEAALRTALPERVVGPVAQAPNISVARRIAVLQPNIDQYAKWDGRYEAEVRGVLERLLASAKELRPELIVWPESALPGWFEDPAISDWIRSRVRDSGAVHIVGALTQDGNLRHNSAVLLSASGRVGGMYHKRRLVPFGEFVPFRFLDRFIGFLAQMGDLDPGPARQPLLATPLGPAGVTVCYEALFPRLNRLAAAGGARILVNVTNDGWYKDTWGPYQHFFANIFRAVENRIYVIRAANTGVSGVFDPLGRVRASLALERRGVLSCDIPADDDFPHRSLYARWGDWFGWLNLAAALTLLPYVRRDP